MGLLDKTEAETLKIQEPVRKKTRVQLQIFQYCASGITSLELEDFRKYLKNNKISFTQFVNSCAPDLISKMKSLK